MATSNNKDEKLEQNNDKKIEKEIKEEKKTRNKRKNLSKIINDKTEVVVMNNTTGIFCYECPKTHDLIEMTSYGDTDIMTIEQLRGMKNRHKGILNKYWILPISCCDEDVSLEDIVRYLRLDYLYKNLDENLNIDTIDNLLLKSSNENFNRLINELNFELVKRIAERSVELSKEDRFHDYSKMRILNDKMGRDDSDTIYNG